MNSFIVLIFAAILSLSLGSFDRHEFQTRASAHAYRRHMHPLGNASALARPLFYLPPLLALLALVVPLYILLPLTGTLYAGLIFLAPKKYPLLLSLYNGISDEYNPPAFALNERVFLH